MTSKNASLLDELQNSSSNNSVLSTNLNDCENRRSSPSNCLNMSLLPKNNQLPSSSLHFVAELSNSENSVQDSDSSLASREDYNNIYVSAHGHETHFFDSISTSQNSEGYQANYFSLNCCNSGLQLGDYSPTPCGLVNDDVPVPTPFHQGEGSRDGIQPNTSIREMEHILQTSQKALNSPLHSRSSIRKVERASHIHHLALTGNNQPYSYTLPDNEFDPITTSKNHLAGHPYDVSAEVVTQPTPGIHNTKNLLHVLLSISEKYDFSHLKVRMVCNAEELNLNAEENAPLCQEFVDTGSCSKEQANEKCTFRHVKSNHIECVVKRIRDGELPICLIRQQDSQYIVADLPCMNGCPGEINPHAVPHAKVCLEFSLRGVCPNDQLFRCHNRHLLDCHPERIALLYRNGQITEFEATAWLLSPCGWSDVNPFASSSDQVCKEFVSTGVCNRNREGKICRFRHCSPERDRL